MLNHFLTAKRHLVDTREITPRTWADYYATCARLKDAFGDTRPVDDLRGDDFAAYRSAIARKWGPVALGNEIQRVRSIFKHAYEAALIDKPIRFGPAFKRPSRRVLRKARAEKGPRMLEAAELQTVINAAKQPMRTMILLGLNCGFGNSDCATLPLKAVNLDSSWIDFPRPKTGVARRCPIWPETAAALREWLARRPEPKDKADDHLVFITRFRTSWNKSSNGDNHANPISWEMKKLLKELKLHRSGLGFYMLRRVMETIGGESRDQPAVDHIMGHAREDMASVYRERISDERLQAVANHVRTWLYG